MKVVVLSNMAQSLANFRGRLLQDLRAAGHEVVAVAPETDDPALASLSAMGVRYVCVPMSRTGVAPVADLAYARRLHALFRAERPDVAFGYTIKPGVYGTLAARWARVPRRVMMVNGLGYAFGASGVRQRLVGAAARGLYRAACRSAHRVVFQNPDDRRTFVELGLARADQTVVVAGSGIDLERFPAVPVPDGPPVFLFVGRLIAEKGVLDFAEAARAVRRDHPDARFHVLGPFDDAPGAVPRSTVEGWAAEGIVTYLGTTLDVRPYLAAATAFVLPSYYREGVPRTALEALATARPVITTDRPGCRETVVDGVNGYLVPDRDPAALADAMRRLLADAERLRAMARASRVLAASRFDVVAVNADMLRALGAEAAA